MNNTSISKSLNINDEYLAFCIDEVGLYYESELRDGKKPRFEEETNTRNNKDFFEAVKAQQKRK